MLISLFRGARTWTPRQASVSRRRSFVPRLEVLEGRSMPSTLTVVNLGDSGAGSLRGQLAAAAPGDTIDFAPELQGTIALGSTLTLDRGVTVVGNIDAGGNPLVTLTRSGGYDYYGGSTDLAVYAGVTASVSGLTLTGATNHAVWNQGNLTLDHVAITGNLIGYDYYGMGTHVFGTVYNEGTLTVQSSTIASNEVTRAPTYRAGGAGIWNTGTLTVADSTLANNLSPTGGVIPGTGYGGGLTNDGGTATVTGSVFTGNIASYGGGIYSTGTLTVIACQVSGNSGAGGGIYASGTALISRSTITGNTGAPVAGIYFSGGGIYFSRGTAGALTLADSTVANNRAGSGGGIYVGTGVKALTVTNTTITGNSATSNGGGIYVQGAILPPSATLNLVNSTVANNQAAGAGGGLWVGATRTQVSLANTLVAGNTAAKGGPDAFGPLLPTSGYNLIGNGDGSTGLANGTNGNQVGTMASPIDPRLGPLQDNGGPTATLALLAGSPAIDAGNNVNALALDQRGFARVVGAGIDIGAYEAQSASPQPGVMTHFGITAAASAVAGAPFSITVQALDDFDTPVPGYVGPVRLTIYDGPAVLTQDHVLTAADAGAHVFGVTLTTAGTQLFTITADTPAGPLTERGALMVRPAAAASLRLSAPIAATAGQSMQVTVTVRDAYGNVATGYTGTVHFASNDARATLPGDVTFNSSNAGTRTFSVTLKTAGSQWITATDTANGSLTASVTGITVAPAALSTLAFGRVPGSTTAGSAFNVTLIASDAYGNTIVGYTGTVHFSSSDGQAVLPADHTFTSADAGTHTFSATLKTAGSQSLTATDIVTSSLTATSAGIVVSPAAAAKFVLTAPASVTHGKAFSLTLTVQDAYGNVVTGYTGTVRFTSSDGTAILPANYTFTAAEAGVHTFSNSAILRKKGMRTVTVTDLANSALTTTVTINVT